MKILHLNLPPVSPELATELLAPLDPELVVLNTRDGADVIEAAHDVDAIIGAAVGRILDHETLAELERCRIVSIWSGSTDYLDPQAFTDNGIAVCFSADACTEEVADHGMAMMLALGRKLFPWDRMMRELDGNYVSHDAVIARAGSLPRLSTRVVGCIGLGRAGMAMATRAKAFGMRVIAHDPFIPQDAGAKLGIELTTKERVLEESDFVHLYVPMKEDTVAIIGVAELARMKPTSYLINTTARSAVIDNDALYEALRDGVIAGAGLDNLDLRPAWHNKILDMDNVILSPHIAHVSDEGYSGMQHRLCEDVVKFFNGEWPELLANPAIKDIVGTPPGTR